MEVDDAEQENVTPEQMREFFKFIFEGGIQRLSRHIYRNDIPVLDGDVTLIDDLAQKITGTAFAKIQVPDFNLLDADFAIWKLEMTECIKKFDRSLNGDDPPLSPNTNPLLFNYIETMRRLINFMETNFGV